MAQSGGVTEPTRPLSAKMLSLEASRTDNVALMKQAISIASSPDQRTTIDEILEHGLRISVRRNSLNVVAYLLTHGADIHGLHPSSITECGAPTTEKLELLLSHGWDINFLPSYPGATPLLWHVVRDGDLVAWCLERGASVHLPPSPPVPDDKPRPVPAQPILEWAASQSTVATFELLRAHGAPLGDRVLHLAVRGPTYYSREEIPETWEASLQHQQNMSDRDRAATYAERMAMVRHLVDVVGLDVNALDHSGRGRGGNHWGTPLCYLVHPGVGHEDAREVIWFLLGRGADPNKVGLVSSALQAAEVSGFTSFTEAVNEWKARQHR